MKHGLNTYFCSLFYILYPSKQIFLKKVQKGKIQNFIPLSYRSYLKNVAEEGFKPVT